MVNQKQKKQMRDYLVSKLEPAYPEIIPKTKEIISGLNSNYITLDNEHSGIVLLVDQEYPKNSFEKLFRMAKKQFKEITGIVFKDGKTFFRNAAERNYFKKNRRLSLKNYTDFEMNRMILFRSEEIFLNSQKDWVHYFQPESDRLKEGIESFKFKSVIFDYSHIDPYERFKPVDTDSKKLYVWEQRVHNEGALKLIREHLT